MNSGIGDNEIRRVCPYDPSHVILQSRMPKHIIQCQKNHPNAKILMEVCLYDTTHIVRKQDLKTHMENCPSKKNVEISNYVVDLDCSKKDHDLAKKADLMLKATQQPSLNWDDVEVESYLKKMPEKLENSFVLRAGEMNMGKSASKEKWKKEEQRLQRLEEK